jgi:hypothetical protein
VADSRESPEKTSTFLAGTGICYVGQYSCVVSSKISPHVYHLVNRGMSFHFLYLPPHSPYSGEEKEMVPVTPPCEKIMLDNDVSLRCAQSAHLVATQLSRILDRASLCCRARGAGALGGDVGISRWGTSFSPQVRVRKGLIEALHHVNFDGLALLLHGTNGCSKVVAHHIFI